MMMLFFIVLLFICAYKAWVISAPYPHPLPYHQNDDSLVAVDTASISGTCSLETLLIFDSPEESWVVFFLT
jgi:hypothetical protein